MNYLAHGYRHVDDPWFVAGTALPDWLRVLDRHARVRPESLLPRQNDSDPRVASLVRGALRHHEDDRRFHGAAAFAETRRAVADVLRGTLSEADGHRPSFVAHLVVEVHLDGLLVEESPARLDAYYAALASIDADAIEAAVRVVDPSAPIGVARLVRAFIRERFLADYAAPVAMLRRLDRVVRRARQPPLPEALSVVFPKTRACVASRRDELLEAGDGV